MLGGGLVGKFERRKAMIESGQVPPKTNLKNFLLGAGIVAAAVPAIISLVEYAENLIDSNKPVFKDTSIRVQYNPTKAVPPGVTVIDAMPGEERLPAKQLKK